MCLSCVFMGRSVRLGFGDTTPLRSRRRGVPVSCGCAGNLDHGQFSPHKILPRRLTAPRGASKLYVGRRAVARILIASTQLLSLAKPRDRKENFSIAAA